MEPTPNSSIVQRASAESVAQPGKVVRIGAIVHELLEDVRQCSLDEAGRRRLQQIHERLVSELADVLPPDLRDELGRIVVPLRNEPPSESEIRLAHAELHGWLAGLFQGLQAAAFAQAAAGAGHLGRPPPQGSDAAGARQQRSGYL